MLHRASADTLDGACPNQFAVIDRYGFLHRSVRLIWAGGRTLTAIWAAQAKSLTGQASSKAESAKDSASRKADQAEGNYKDTKKAWWQFWKNDVQVGSFSNSVPNTWGE